MNTPENRDSAAYASVWSDLTPVAFEQGWLDAGGIRTRYLMSGDRTMPLLLLLHGVGGHAEAYTRNLAAHAPHFWTVAIDMIGHGWTDKPDISYELPQYERHILAVLGALGRDSAMISGESLGGWVAAWIAVHHPTRVNKLVLNTAGGWTAHPEVMARIKGLSNEAASDPSWERIRTRLEFLMFNKTTVTDDLIATRQRIYAQPGFAASMQRIMCLQDMETRRRNMISESQYRSIVAPTLVVWTSHDPTATPEEGEQIAKMVPGAHFIVLNQCGHWPQYEDAELFNRVHVDFLLGKDIRSIPGARF